MATAARGELSAFAGPVFSQSLVPTGSFGEDSPLLTASHVAALLGDANLALFLSALVAMGVPDDRLRCSVRFSLGAATSETEIDEAISRVAAVLGRRG